MYFSPLKQQTTAQPASNNNLSPLLRQGALRNLRQTESSSAKSLNQSSFQNQLNGKITSTDKADSLQNSRTASAQSRIRPDTGVMIKPNLNNNPVIDKSNPPELPEGVSIKEGKVYFRGDYVAAIDLAKGGQLDKLYYNGEQMLSGNGMWMHSSPEGAADGTGLGYEMALDEEPKVTVNGNQVVVEGKLMQSNGSGKFAGHRYRRTYTFDSDNSFTVKHDMWVSPEDKTEAKKMFGQVPDDYYVWACPMDANLPNYYWNAGDYYEGVADRWDEKNAGGMDKGRIPDRPQGELNWGYTTTLDKMGQTPTMALYREGGPAIVRQVIGGDLAQVNFWRNMKGIDARTLEFSVIGGDRRFFESDYDVKGHLTGGETFSFTERVTVGKASKLIPTGNSQRV